MKRYIVFILLFVVKINAQDIHTSQIQNKIIYTILQWWVILKVIIEPIFHLEVNGLQ